VRLAVCIPTLDASSAWENLRASLEAQILQPNEILVIDSSSSDGTAELAKRDRSRVVVVSRAEFCHGGTRQRAAELLAEADILVYLTQDAILADAKALTRLAAAFEDPSVGAAYGRQLPRRGSNPIEAHARLFNYPAGSAIRSSEDRARIGFKSIFFSNSFGAYRRTALEQVGGFPRQSNFGEDTVVAARLLENNWRIAYVADAQVYHSHPYGLRDEFRRYRQIGKLHGSEPWLLRNFGSVKGEGGRFVISEIRYLLPRAPWLVPESLLRSAIKYCGYRLGRGATLRK
jgi:rhamnosyltransferase